MKIAYVSAGAAGMLCGSCMHDNTLAAAIRRLGHDIVLLPTYTPIRTDEQSVSGPEVFYGAVNVYLQDKSGLFRSTPRFLDRWLDHPALLAWASRRGSAVDAAGLGGLTLSVLQGEEGHQGKELKRLVAWMRDEFAPDIVHLTNSLFLGLAAPLKRELKVPVVCSVQGEDLFLDGLTEPGRTQVNSLLRERAGDADAIIATTSDYAQRMSAILGVPAAKMRVVKLGLNLEGHGAPAAPRPDSPFVIGYLARVCPEKGFHLIVDAFTRLAGQVGRDRVRLVAAGYLGPRDSAYFEGEARRIASAGLASRFEYLGEVDRPAKIRMLGSLDVLSVPSVYRESKGLYVLEALANGVPVVEPRHGSFPEMIERTGGGLLFTPGSVDELTACLLRMMQEPGPRRAMGDRGRAAVREHYTDEMMARETIKVYLAALQPGPPR